MTRYRRALTLLLAPTVLLGACGEDDPEASPGVPVIAEIVHAPKGDDLGPEGEHVVLRNEGDIDADVGGWLLRTRTGAEFPLRPSTKLKPGASLRIYTGTGTSTTGKLYFGFTAEALSDDGGRVELFDAAGEQVEARDY